VRRSKDESRIRGPTSHPVPAIGG